jgi:hypothetical protein
VKLQHVLSRSGKADINLEHMRSEELKKAARFWVGKEAYKFNKDACLQALNKVFQDKTLVKRVLPELSAKQKPALGIFARYGPVVSGSLLTVELEQRGLIEKKDDATRYYSYRRRGDVINDLQEKLILVSGFHDYYSHYNERYPELTLHPALAGAIEPAAPLPWQPSEPSFDAAPVFARSPTEVALDLWRVADALREMGDWKTVKGDALSKGSQNKLRKLVALPSSETDNLAPPDAESLFYELLREMRFFSVVVVPRTILATEIEKHFDQPPAAQAWCWLRAWLNMRLWQDGIGVVPDRDSYHDSVRIDPDSLRTAKELLIWALCRVAHSNLNWLDLENFLIDFWKATHDASSTFYWYGYAWMPEFELSRQKEKLPAGPQQSLAFWLASGGTLAANAIMVTLATLGLIERGETGGKTKRPAFRLTPLGRQVFKAPEVEIAEPPAAGAFLTVQPNHDILAYLADADARGICKLARFARRTGVTSGHVQTFSLTRESVYTALESGLTAADIETFLTQHSKTPLPANVLRTLQDWSGKRESLVLHTAVTLALVPDKTSLAGLDSKSRPLSDTGAMLPALTAKKAAKDFAGWSIFDHHTTLPRTWQATELGELKTTSNDLLSQCRLASLADPATGHWLISEKSISRARKQGFSADRLLDWLAEHLTHPTPALLTTAIRNWTGRTPAFSGKVHLLQVTRAEARDAVLHSAAFRPMLVGHIPPDWFIIHNDKVAEMERLLKRLGFQMEEAYRMGEK